MSHRLTRALLLISLGGTTLGIGGLTCHPFAQSGPYTTFLSNAGQVAIGTAIDSVTTNAGTDAKNIIIAPATDLFQTLWSAWVGQTFGLDPTFNRLLVE